MWRRVFVWGLGGALLVALLLWLVLSVLEQTTLTADFRRHEASAETTLGNLSCRKDFQTTFPFFVLTCRDAREP